MTATLTAVAEIAAALARHPIASLGANTTLESLGLDSLDRVALAARLEERFARPLPDRVLVTARTIGDLERHFAAAQQEGEL